MRRLTTILLITVLSGCSDRDGSPSPQAVRSGILTSNQITPVLTPQEIAICEAVFLYQYAQSKGNTHANVPYVLSMKGSMKDKDPADIVMKQLANHNPQFRRKSAGSFKQEAWIELSIEAIESIDDKHVQVSAGYDRATSDITLGTYFLEERDGKWLVTNCEIHARGGG